MDANLLPAFLRLQELTKLSNLCVFFLSDIVWEKFRMREGLKEPIQIHFPQYTKGMVQGKKIMHIIVTVLFKICFIEHSNNIPVYKEIFIAKYNFYLVLCICELEWLILPTDELVEILLRDHAPGGRWPYDFYCSYVKLFLGIFHRACRDLNELRHMVSVNPLEMFSLSELVICSCMFITRCIFFLYT